MDYMGYMFDGARSFNQPLNNWDVFNVEDMASMFLGATSFNQPLNNWNVSNVKDAIKHISHMRHIGHVCILSTRSSGDLARELKEDANAGVGGPTPACKRRADQGGG